MIEIYSQEWCPYCIKAKRLLDSKAVKYTVLDITSDRKLEREMIERSGRRTVPQIFIDGEGIGGYDDLARLNAAGELDRILGRTAEPSTEKLYDLAVIGAGPAGLSAALYGARKNLSLAMIALDPGGQMGSTRDVENWPGTERIDGPDLVERMLDHLGRYQVDRLIGERVVSIEVRETCKVLHTESDREVQARAVIIASGAFKRKLGIPGEKELSGRGVVYCSTCDGPLFANKTVAVIGSGNSGLEAAIEMSTIANRVYLISREGLAGDRILQDKVKSSEKINCLLNHEPVEIHGSKGVEGLTIRDLEEGKNQRLEVEGVFIEVGLAPNSDFVLDLVETNPAGEILTGRDGSTGVHGVFAAGDVTDGPFKQIVIAAGDGARAALSAFKYLLQQV
ncbi:MAG: glutaredoxin 3 [Candidatus Erginobacter occultus]|nr:glutaredoxin 3 [Candidatus Erginobacter occultus]